MSSLLFNSPDRIIRVARANAGLLQEGDDPTSEQYADGFNRLQDIVNFLQTSGLKLWLQSELQVALVAGQNSYSFGPSSGIVMTKPLRVLQGLYADSSGNQRPLTVLARKDWMQLPTLGQQGAVISYFVDKQATQLVVKFWQTPDTEAATGTVTLLLQEQATSPVTLNSAMDFPSEWFLALQWLLADEICGGQPPAIMQRCQMRAAFYKTALEDWDVEDAPVMIVPDPQMTYGQSKFR